MVIKQARFLTSVIEADKLKNDLPEIAFAGKSNCGKSSLINMLVNNKKLAITSSTPGRTRLVNYFVINEKFYFVDLPGYGYAKSGKAAQERFSELIEIYLKSSHRLKLLFILIDIRNGANENDKTLLQFCNVYQIPFVVVATKFDKIKRSEMQQKIMRISTDLAIGKENIILSSSLSGEGKSKLLAEIEKAVD